MIGLAMCRRGYIVTLKTGEQITIKSSPSELREIAKCKAASKTPCLLGWLSNGQRLLVGMDNINFNVPIISSSDPKIRVRLF